MHSISDAIECMRNELSMRVLELRGNVLLDEARSALATCALDMGADVTVFIDSDMDFDPLDVERLAAAARKTGGLVGAPYSPRQVAGSPVSAPTPSSGDAPVRFFEGGDLHPTSHTVGLGFTAIHRGAYERVATLPGYEYVTCKEGIVRPFFQRLIVDKHWLPEDASFCHALRAAGGTTHVHAGFRVGHVGDYTYQLEDCQLQVPRMKQLELRLKLPDT